MEKAKKKRILKVILIILLCPAVLLGVLFASTCIAGAAQTKKNIEYQENHLEYLRNEYYTDSYVPCDEQKLADFNIEEAYSQNVKINEIAVIGTHNSYQMTETLPNRMLMKILSFITFGAVTDKTDFEMDTLTQQLEHGIRNIELDIETAVKGDDISFVVSHIPLIESVSSAYDFSKALEEIALWSDNNPDHLPVYLLIEPKSFVPPVNNLKSFTLDYALALDNEVKTILGDRLLTPQDAKGEYASLEEMRMHDAWPTLESAKGKIIVLMHTCDVTPEYIAIDETISTQAMFPMLDITDIDKSYASFILANKPKSAAANKNKTIDEKNLMVRTRADSYPSFSDERYKYTEVCGSHIITTDYPPRTVRENEHTYTLGGYMMKLLK